MSSLNKYLVVGVIIGLVIGGILGFILGANYAIHYMVKLGYGFLEHEGIKLDIDEGMLATAIYQYRNNLGGCLFTNKTDALIRFNTGD